MSDQHEKNLGLAQIRLDRDGGTVTATLTGEVDMSNADDIQDQLTTAAEGADLLVVDLSALSFVDSAGIAGLDRLHRTLSSGPTRLQVTAGRGTVVGRTLALAGMDQVLPMMNEDAPRSTG